MNQDQAISILIQAAEAAALTKAAHMQVAQAIQVILTALEEAKNVAKPA